jgi:hypothetical protein
MPVTSLSRALKQAEQRASDHRQIVEKAQPLCGGALSKLVQLDRPGKVRCLDLVADMKPPMP